MKKLLVLSMVLAALMGSVSAQAATVAVGDSANNNVKRRAVSLDTYFDKSANANIFNATSVPHATAQVTTSSGNSFDWFSFTVASANTTVYIDIDSSTGGLNTFLRLEDSLGNLVANNNNSAFLDPGSSTVNDSFLNVVLDSAGLYRIRVGNRVGTSTVGLTAGQNYNMHVSLVAPEVPVPAAIWLFGSAFMGLVGIGGSKRKTIAA